MSVYGTSPVKRQRRTRDELDALDDTIIELLIDEHPATVRGVFYRCVSVGAVPKDEARGYKAVQRRLLTLRRDGRVPYGWITDGTRWRIKPDTWGSVSQLLNDAAASYRRALWHDQATYVELWIEKQAIAGVIEPVTAQWDVPLHIARGYASESFLYECARDLAQIGKPAVIYQLGDHDPSGVGAWEHTQDKLRTFAPHADVTFERLAVTPDQIVQYDLLTRTTKASDTRARGWRGDSVDVDAIAPSTLREIVGAAITRHLDPNAYRLTLMAEQQERELLESMVWNGGAA